MTTRSKSRKPRVRNFAAEYQRRIERAEALAKAQGKTISRSQARGHARLKKGETKISEIIRPVLEAGREEKFYQAINVFLEKEHSGKPIKLSTAAKKAGLSPQTLERLEQEHRLLFETGGGKHGRSYRAAAAIFTQDGEHFRIKVSAKYASMLGKYNEAVKKAKRGKTADLEAFAGQTIRDVHGKQYLLSGDISQIETILSTLPPDELDIANRFESEGKESRGE